MESLVPVCTNPTHPDTLHFDNGDCQPCQCEQPCDMDDDWVCWNRVTSTVPTPLPPKIDDDF